MSDGQHCFYLCKKVVQTKDKTGQRCEAIFRKDQVKSINDLQHSCFYLEGNISRFFEPETKKKVKQNPKQDSIAAIHMVFVGKANLSMENAVSNSLFD